jgi:hypothetical protein
MKKILVLFAILFTTPVCAQITLEHTYPITHIRIRLMQIDSNEYKYVLVSADSISLYSLDHSLYKLIIIPPDNTLPDSPAVKLSFGLYYISRHLFDVDDKIEYIGRNGTNNKLELLIYNEDGKKLFGCNNCTLKMYGGPSSGITADGLNDASLVNTEEGAKMIVYRDDTYQTEIYSLPGKLPTNSTKLSVTDAPTIISSSSPSTSAYPNPSNGKIRVVYSLPDGVTTGELIISSTDGREVKRYRVGNMFNDILIEKSELASGTYFYKLITERGESQARKFVITN